MNLTTKKKTKSDSNDSKKMNWKIRIMITVSTWAIILCLRIFSLSRILIATFSPVSTFRANLTFAKLPSPRVRPSSYFPTRVLPWLLAAAADDDDDDFDAISFLSISLKIFSLSKQIKNTLSSSKSNWLFSLSLFFRANGSRPLLLARLPHLRLCHPHFLCLFVLKWKYANDKSYIYTTKALEILELFTEKQRWNAGR